jgi:hypothetical protein
VGLLVVLSLLATAALAAAPSQPTQDQQATFMSEGFLRFHPDINYRNVGLKALEDGFPRHARDAFLRAARHADKASQAALAEMYFTGNGVPRDRALGYAWMDLAAERAYPVFLAYREHYWSQMSEAERERAIEVGQDIYAQYEDAVAKPRLERQLRRGKRQSTGSRVGSPLFLEVVGLHGIQSRKASFQQGARPAGVAGETYYSSNYWQPRDYWTWKDQIWTELPEGEVEVQPLQPVDERN